MSVFKIGDRVKTLKHTRHKMVLKGTVGVVVEIREKGDMIDGVCVEFMLLPDPIIAKMFRKDANVPEPFRCLFPFSSVNRQIAKV